MPAPPPAPLLPGAEPWSADGGPVSVLVVHAFAAAGCTVSLPLPLLPGHGTGSSARDPSRSAVGLSAAADRGRGLRDPT